MTKRRMLVGLIGSGWYGKCDLFRLLGYELPLAVKRCWTSFAWPIGGCRSS